MEMHFFPEWRYARVRPLRTSASTRLIALLTTVLPALLTLQGCGRSDTTHSAIHPVLTVDLVSPKTSSWTDSIDVNGEIFPWQEAVIGAEISGARLETVLVNVGDVVKRGQLLAHYNEDLLQADLLQLNAAVDEASAKLAKVQADEKRTVAMQAIGALSKQALDDAQSQSLVATAQLAAATARRDAQALKVRRARVVAPDDGVISSRTATVGAVNVLGDELFRMVRRQRLEWRAEVPADILSQIKPGLSADIKRPDGSVVAGTLRQIAPKIESGTRNAIAYVDVSTSNGLAPGMYLTGRLVTGVRPALTLPETAVVLRDGKRFLMEVDDHHLVHEVEISVGRRRDGDVEVVGDNLVKGRYIKSAGAFVSEGDPVQLAAPEAKTP